MQIMKKRQTAADPAVRKRRTRGQEIWHRFKKNKLAVIATIVFILMVLSAVFADALFNYEEVVIKPDVPNKLQTPSAQHWLGTDELGRDLLARIVHGGRISLSVGVVAVLTALAIGGTLGVVAGYYGGFIGETIMRVSDVFAAIPSLLMAIAVVSALGQSTLNLMIAVGVATVPNYIRITRAAVIKVKDQEYIEAAKAIGANNFIIIMTHVLPNCLSPIIVNVTLRLANAILSISGLSFLGLGVKAPTPEWGSMLSAGRNLLRDAPHVTLFPGLAIMIAILCLNLIGDGLRDALDPKMKT